MGVDLDVSNNENVEESLFLALLKTELNKLHVSECHGNNPPSLRLARPVIKHGYKYSGKPRSGKVRQVRAELKIAFPFAPSMLTAQATFLHSGEAGFDSLPPKKCPWSGVTERVPPKHSGRIWPSEKSPPSRRFGCRLMDTAVPHPSRLSSALF